MTKLEINNIAGTIFTNAENDRNYETLKIENNMRDKFLNVMADIVSKYMDEIDVQENPYVT